MTELGWTHHVTTVGDNWETLDLLLATATNNVRYLYWHLQIGVIPRHTMLGDNKLPGSLMMASFPTVSKSNNGNERLSNWVSEVNAELLFFRIAVEASKVVRYFPDKAPLMRHRIKEWNGLPHYVLCGGSRSRGPSKIRLGQSDGICASDRSVSCRGRALVRSAPCCPEFKPNHSLATSRK